MPLSPEESNSAEGFLLCVPGRSLRRSSIRCFEALIPTRCERGTSERRCGRGTEPKGNRREDKGIHTETSEYVLQVLFRDNAVGVVVDQRKRLSKKLDLIWLKE